MEAPSYAGVAKSRRPKLLVPQARSPVWYDHASVPVASSIAKISPLHASPKTSPSVASNGRYGLTSTPTLRSTTHRVSPVVASNAYSWSLDCPANAAYRTPLSNDGVPVRAPLKPSLRSHWIVPLYGSRADRKPSHVVSNNVASAKIGLLHWLFW